LQEQPITREAIYYNLIKSKEQKVLAKMYPESSRNNIIGKSYAQTYRRNALLLKQGKRLLTKN